MLRSRNYRALTEFNQSEPISRFFSWTKNLGLSARRSRASPRRIIFSHNYVNLQYSIENFTQFQLFFSLLDDFSHDFSYRKFN